jgi:hypothetical protein
MGHLPWREEETRWVARMDLVAVAETMLADLLAAADMEHMFSIGGDC